MSSNTLATIRKYLRDEIKPQLPTRWRIIPELSEAQNLVVPALYFEFTEVANEIGGTPLHAGAVAANFDLIVVTPQTDTTKAENAVDAAVVDLILALDSSEGLFWGPSARKERLATGQMGWRIPVSVLTFTTPAPDPAPAPTP